MYGSSTRFVPVVGPLLSTVVMTPPMLEAILGSPHGIHIGNHPFRSLKQEVSGARTSLIG